MMTQAETALNEEPPDRLSVVLKNPSAEWSEIRAAMKAQGGGCTNLTIVSALSSKGGEANGNCGGNNKSQMKPEDDKASASADDPDDKADNEKAAASAPASASGGDKVMPLGNRRASLTSQDSSSSGRPSMRGIRRQTSRRRAFRQGRNGSRRFLLRSSVNNSIRSITLDSLNESSSSLNNSSSDFNNSSSIKLSSGGLGFHESIDIMDFGISQNGLRAALGVSDDRSCSSLDDGTLDDLQESCDEGSRRELLVSWKNNSLLSKEKSKRELLVSFRHDSTLSGFDDSVRSEGDLNSYVDSCGFLDWPAAKEEEKEKEVGSDAIKEGDDTDNTHKDSVSDTAEGSDKEHPHKEEEWNIEDYEGGEDSDQGQLPRNNSISTSTMGMGMAVAKTLKRFSTTRRSSNSSSTSEDMDLAKIKEALPALIAKNRQQSTEVDASNSKKKRAGSISLIGMFQQSLDAETEKDEKPTEQVSRRKSRKEVIWARDSTKMGLNEEYKQLYAPAPQKKAQRNSWNIFERRKSNEVEDDFSERRSSS